MKTTIPVKNNDWHTKPLTIKDNRFINRYKHKQIPTTLTMWRLLNKEM